MNAVSTDFLQLIRSYLWGETPRLRRPDWDGLYELARIHNLTPMIYEAAQGLPAFANASEAVKHAFLESTLQMIVGQQRRTGLLFHIYQKLTDAGLRPLVLKGLVCRLLYPEPDARVSSDEDLWIAPHEFAACDRILSENGFTRKVSAVTETLLQGAQTVAYTSPYLELEVHLNPFGTQTDLYQRMSNHFPGAFSNAVSLTIGGTVFYTLQPTDHYLFLLLHLYKHFLSSGAGIRQVMDLLLFYRQYEAQLDAERIQETLSYFHLGTFYAAIWEIGREALHIPLPSQGKGLCVQPLLTDLLERGAFGRSNDVDICGGQYTRSFLSDTDTPVRHPLLRTLFPPVGQLWPAYPILLLRPALLPLCWGHRFLRFGKKLLQSGPSLAVKSLRIGKQRALLFQQYGLFHERNG